jgi:hypothetical protein
MLSSLIIKPETKASGRGVEPLLTPSQGAVQSLTLTRQLIVKTRQTLVRPQQTALLFNVTERSFQLAIIRIAIINQHATTTAIETDLAF